MSKCRGIGGHHSHRSRTTEWLTPPEIIEQLGPFDLDPCSPRNRPWDTAKQHYTLDDDGLKLPWHGRVWLNPPYGRETEEWIKRLSLHGNGIALIFAKTETRMFFRYIWSSASAVLFIRGRLHFHHADGTRAVHNSGAPSVLISYDKDVAYNADALWSSRLGACVLP